MNAARDQLINQHLYLVPNTVTRVVKSVPPGIERADLEGEGYLALVKAAARFDPARGVKFSSYALSLIRGAMLDFLREEDWAPRSVREKQKRGEPVHIWQLVSLEEYLGAADSDDHDLIYRLDCIADPAKGPGTLVVAADEQERLWQAVGCLPKKERFVVEQYYLEGLLLREVAALLGRSESRTHQIRYDAIRRLREWGWAAG